MSLVKNLQIALIVKSVCIKIRIYSLMSVLQSVYANIKETGGIASSPTASIVIVLYILKCEKRN